MVIKKTKKKQAVKKEVEEKIVKDSTEKPGILVDESELAELKKYKAIVEEANARVAPAGKVVDDGYKYFADFDIDYCQYKPEVVNREREDGIQREIDFWNNGVEPLLIEAKIYLVKNFR